MASTIVQAGPFIDTGNYVKTVLYGFTQGQLIMSSFYHQAEAKTGVGITVGDLAKQLEDNWAANLAASMYADYNFLGARSQILLLVPLLKAGVATDIASGTLSTAQSPLNVGAIVEKKTAIAGRAGRGRTYMPPPDVTLIDTDGTPLAAFVTTCQAAVASILQIPYASITGAAGGTCNLTPILWSVKTRSGTPVTGVVARKLFGQQHRRGNYGKPNLPYIPL